jgi:hypothetical protein
MTALDFWSLIAFALFGAMTAVVAAALSAGHIVKSKPLNFLIAASIGVGGGIWFWAMGWALLAAFSGI